jgi:hypothetical protein
MVIAPGRHGGSNDLPGIVDGDRAAKSPARQKTKQGRCAVNPCHGLGLTSGEYRVADDLALVIDGESVAAIAEIRQRLRLASYPFHRVHVENGIARGPHDQACSIDAVGLGVGAARLGRQNGRRVVLPQNTNLIAS